MTKISFFDVDFSQDPEKFFRKYKELKLKLLNEKLRQSQLPVKAP